MTPTDPAAPAIDLANVASEHAVSGNVAAGSGGEVAMAGAGSPPRRSRRSAWRSLRLVVAALLAIAAAIGGVRAAWAQWRPAGDDVPTTVVRRGDVDTSIHAVGELKTIRTRLLTAPAVGGQLRLLTLKPTGTRVAAGEIVMTFDPADLHFTLDAQRALLQEAELEIAQRNAEAAAQRAQDRVDLLTARFDVRKAELDTRGRDLLSAITARQHELSLEEARRRLAQLEEDVASHAATSGAALAVAREKRAAAALAMARAQQAIAAMTVRAPIDGIIAVSGNRDGLNFFFQGMTLPEYREGDSVSSGREVVEVLDVGEVEIVARVAETDRARVATGQRATLWLEGLLDGRHGVPLGARVTTIGMIRNPRGTPGGVPGPVRQLEVSLALDRPLAVARPGSTARVRIAGQPIANALYVPRQAVFDREGTPIVYVRRGDRFEPHPVTITARTEALLVIGDLPEGTEIALIDPAAPAARREQGARVRGFDEYADDFLAPSHPRTSLPRRGRPGAAS